MSFACRNRLGVLTQLSLGTQIIIQGMPFAQDLGQVSTARYLLGCESVMQW